METGGQDTGGTVAAGDALERAVHQGAGRADAQFGRRPGEDPGQRLLFTDWLASFEQARASLIQAAERARLSPAAELASPDHEDADEHDASAAA